MLNKYKNSVALLPFFVASLLLVHSIGSAQVYKHNFGTTTISAHPYTAAPATIAANLSQVSWTNSVSDWGSGTGATGRAIQVSTTSGSSIITLKLNVAPNYQLAITSFDFWRVRSSSGPQSWSLKVGSTTIGTGSTQTSGSATGNTPVLSPVSNLTGAVTITLTLSGGSGNGNFRLDDFTLYGSVTSSCSASVTSFSPASGPHGTAVIINGSGFTGATAVKFNGQNATSFTVVDNNTIKAIVPSGASAGNIIVQSAANCPATSSASFSALTTNCSSGLTEIFISELYDQRQRSGGMIELYNPTTSPINMNGNYKLLRYGTIAETTPSYELVLTGTIPALGTYLIACDTPEDGICVTPNEDANLGNGFNGGDKFELYKNNALIDLIKVPVASAGYNMIRKPDAIAPSATYSDNAWTTIQHESVAAIEATYCSTLGSHSVNSVAGPTVNQPASATACAGGTATFSVSLSAPSGYTYQWKMLNASGNWVNVTNGSNYSGATTNTLTLNAIPQGFDGNQYYCQLTSALCTIPSKAVQLTLTNLATPVAAVTQQPDCTNATGTITVTPQSGVTYSIDGTTYGSTTTFSGLANGTYTVYVKNAAGCIASLPNLTINPAPSAPATPIASVTQQPDCTTTTGTITVTPQSGMTYSIDGTTYGNSASFSGLTNGTYTVYVKNAAGCIASLPNLTINPAPSAPATPVASVTQQPDCTTTTGTITVTPQSGMTYSIDGTTYGNNTTFSGLTNGSYTVYVKNAAGCIASLPNLIINPAPSAPATPVASVTQQPDCTNTTGTITVTPQSGMTYSIDGTTYVNNTTFSGLTNGSYTVYVKNAAGCIASLPNLTINPAPSAPATPVASVTQQPDCTTTTGTITVTPQSVVTYSIDGTTYGNSATFSGLTNGSYTVYVKNAAGCIASLPNLTISPAPSAPATPVASVTQQPDCTNTTGTITVTPQSGVTYSIDGTTYGNSATFSGLTNGSYTVYVKNAAGCIASLPNLTINPAPSAPATPVASVTQQPDCTTTTGTITVTPQSGMTYSIDGTTYGNNTTFSGLANGTYTVYVKNAAGCIASLPNLTINPAPSAPATPVASVTQQPDCTNATGTITVTPQSGMTYSIDGTTYGNSASFSGLTNGTYTVYVKNAAGCIASLPNLTINPAPSAPATPVASVTQQPDCTNTTGTITITPQSGMTYSIDGTTYGNSATFSGLTNGSYTVYVKNAAGCIASLPNITVNPAPSAPATPLASVTQPDCTTTTGTITVTPQSGVTYSIDDTTYGNSGTFSGLTNGTYTVYVKNAAGCIASLPNITVNPAPSAPATPLASVTQPDCTTTTGTITVTPQSGMTYSIDGTTYGNNTTFSGLTNGSYTVYVKNAAGCIATQTGLVVNPQPLTPAAPLITAAQPTCQTAGTISVTAPIAGYSYSLNGGPFQSAPNFSNLGSGVYSVVTRSPQGCISAASATVTLNAAPAVPATPVLDVTQPDCTVPTGTIRVTTPVGGAYTYSIDNTTYQPSPLFANVPTGVYTVRVKNTDGCMASTTISIIAQPGTPLTPQLSVTQPTCTTPAGITVQPQLGGPFTYSLDGGAYQASAAFTNVPAGPHAVTIRNASGCTATSGITTINPVPAVPAAPVASVTQQPTCTVATGIISVTPSPAPGLTYSIDGVTFGSSTTFSGLVSGSYTITVKNASGCTASVSGLVVNPQPATPAAPVITATQPTCSSPTGSIRVSGGSTSPSYTYSIDGITYQGSPLFNGLSAGAYSVTIKNASGCVSAASATVIINAQPATPAAPVAIVTQPDCTTATGTIMITPVPGQTDEYSINGTTWQLSNTFANLVPGLYTIRMKNSGGCTSQAQVRIFAQPATPAVPTLAITQPTCSTATGTVVVTAPVGPYTYSVDGITFISTRTFSGLTTGTYTITVKNAAGCTAVSSVITIDTPPAAAPNPGTITGGTDVCRGGTIQLSNTATGGAWSSSNANVATVDANGLVTTVGTGNVIIKYTTGTVCTAAATHAIRVHALPNLMLPTELISCIDNATNIGSYVTIATNLSPTQYTFVWKKNGTLLSDTSSSLSVNDPGQYEVTVTNTATGCSATDETIVKASSIALAYAEVTQDFDFRQTIQVHITGGSGDYIYSLNGGAFQDSPVFGGIYQGEYTITVKDKNLCGELDLTVYALNYPRFFSPNGDGANDKWNISGLAAQQNARIHIFDRYGKIVASIKPNGPGWDGTYNGSRLPATDYWFTLLYTAANGQEKEFKAHFSLIR